MKKIFKKFWAAYKEGMKMYGEAIMLSRTI